MNRAYLLVVLSAALHAYWNFVLKRRGGAQLFVGLSKIAEVLIFAPVFVIVLALSPERAPALWPDVAVLVLVGATLSLANYVALAHAYQLGDLALVYPLSRGAGLLFLPPLGFLVFGERLGGLGWTALGLILAGLIALHARPAGSGAANRARRSAPAVWYAVLAGLAAAAYTIWDKHAVSHLQPFIYFYSYSTLVAAAYGAFLSRRFPRVQLVSEWRVQRSGIVQVAVCNTAAYVLVLFALTSEVSTYVIALRQLSIVMGVGLGVWRLGESMPTSRKVGIVLVLSGCVLVAFAR